MILHIHVCSHVHVHVNVFHFQQTLHLDHESSDRTLREKDEELNNLKQITMKLQNELSTYQTVAESNLKNSLEQLVLLNVHNIQYMYIQIWLFFEYHND